MAGSWAPAYDSGVGQVSQEDYCFKQVSNFGLNPALCAQRYQAFIARARGKGNKAYSRWANGKGTG
jgi:hypothetical protein